MTPARAIGLGGLVVGTLDILDAFVFFWLRSGVRPARILHSISAGLLGREAAIAGGAATAALGLALHFLIAFTVVAAAVLAAVRVPALARRPLVTGPLYGLAVYAVMNYIVIPLSAAPGGGGVPAWPVLLNGLLIHVFGVGIPAMWFARAAARGTSPVRSL
jgi:hypothetical protein